MALSPSVLSNISGYTSKKYPLIHRNIFLIRNEVFFSKLFLTVHSGEWQSMERESGRQKVPRGFGTVDIGLTSLHDLDCCASRMPLGCKHGCIKAPVCEIQKHLASWNCRIQNTIFYFQVTIHLWKDHSEHYTPFYNRAPLSPTHWTLKKNWISCSKMVPYSFQLRWSVTYKWQGNISPVPLHETFQFLWNPMAESCTIQWVILECLWFSGNVLIIVFFDVRNICDDTCA